MDKRILMVLLACSCAGGPPVAPAATSPDDVLARAGVSVTAARLETAFPATETGRAWARFAALASGHGEETRRAGLAQLTLLGTHAQEALRDLRAGLAALGPEQARARQLVVQIAARLPAPLDERIQLLADELARPAGDGQAFFDPAIAVDALAEIVTDRDRLEALVRAGVARQPTAEARQLMAARLRAVDATRGERLLAELTAE
jgi:hypothetical protein